VALQLPPERRPPGWDWEAAADLAAAFSHLAGTSEGSSALLEALQGSSGSRDGSGRVGGGGSGMGGAGAAMDPVGGVLGRLLRSTAQLVLQMPSWPVVAANHERILAACWLSGQLGHAAKASNDLYEAQRPGAAAAAAAFKLPAALSREQLQLASLLQQAAPKVSAALSQLLACQGSVPASVGCLATTCEALDSVVLFADQLSPKISGQPHAVTLELLPAWCMSAVAAIQALPIALQAAELVQHVGQGDSQVQERFLCSAFRLVACMDITAHGSAVSCMQAAENFRSGWVQTPHVPGGMPPAGSWSSAADALWQLHTASCRLINWLAATGNEDPLSSLLTFLKHPAGQLNLLARPLYTMKEMMRLHQSCQEACSGAAGGLPEGDAVRSWLSR